MANAASPDITVSPAKQRKINSQHLCAQVLFMFLGQILLTIQILFHGRLYLCQVILGSANVKLQ